MRVSYSLREIAAQLGGEVQGDDTVVVSRMASLTGARSGDLSFLANSKYRSQLSGTAASAVVIGPDDANATALPRIVTGNPYAYFAKVSSLLNPVVPVVPGVHPTADVHPSAVIDPTASIGAHVTIGAHVRVEKNAVLGPGCAVGDGVRIGEDTRLHANVTVYDGCELGARCVLSSGVVIGADGFGYAEEQGRWVKIPQVGRVQIQDDVDIGSNTTIDRGALDDTVIE
ncbi:partial UDP-3-O-[3-hydroxymyristoyl] glucosamine N-acyltransferase, partial [Anaerolineae bacterium]